MTALLILVPVSLGLGLIGLVAFFWSLRRGQFEDLEGNAWRVVLAEASPQDRPASSEPGPDVEKRRLRPRPPLTRLPARRGGRAHATAADQSPLRSESSIGP